MFYYYSLTNLQSAYNYHKVKLNDLKPGHTLEITIGLIYTDVLKPYPAELSLEEKGTLYFEGSVYPLSAYDQENTLTTIKVRDQNAKQVIIDNGKSSEPSLFGRINNGFLIYGPYDSVDAFSTSKFGVLYSHNYPLTHVTKLERDIWVSHWGASLSIEERYQLTNHAAKLKGTFSRLDWTRNLPTTAQSSVISAIEVQLTESAREIYYTDLVGNVSTSRVAQRGAVKILQLKPRFPIFGGWHYNFTIGWSSDLANYVKSLTTSKDSYILRVPIVEGPLDTTYENVELSFYLPEGSIIEDLETLVPYDSRDDLIVKSFLDTKGRTVVKLHYSKMFDYYRVATVLVKYKYTSEVHYSKPLKLASIIFTGLLTIFLFSKIDISISKKKAKEIQF